MNACHRFGRSNAQMGGDKEKMAMTFFNFINFRRALEKKFACVINSALKLSALLVINKCTLNFL